MNRRGFLAGLLGSSAVPAAAGEAEKPKPKRRVGGCRIVFEDTGIAIYEAYGDERLDFIPGDDEYKKSRQVSNTTPDPHESGIKGRLCIENGYAVIYDKNGNEVYRDTDYRYSPVPFTK